MKARVSRRHVLAAAAVTVTPAAALAAGKHDDPVFAAINGHRQAVQARQASMGGETREDDKITQQLLDVERDAWRA